MNHDQPRHLAHLLDQAIALHPERVAVEDETGRTLTYRDVDHAAGRLWTRLARWGVGRGDRVGLMLPKSCEAVAAIHGILRSGAAYVPVDHASPATRAAGIFSDCGVRAVVISAALAEPLRAAWTGPGPMPRLILVGERDGALRTAPTDTSWGEVQEDDAPAPLVLARDPNDLAYVLFTSGSTGRPKGVMLSHANAFCFLDWCDRTLDFHDGDRFASHAPFHFDLSILDLFAPPRRGGAVVLIGESLGRDPARLGSFLDSARLDVWYSAPSILTLLGEHGGIERLGPAAPRVVLFAGEVFPIRPLRRLRSAWPDSEMWNLYGPTETNVCTAYPIPAVIAESRREAFPIGPVCLPMKARVVDEAGRDVPRGSIGELIISGPGVMLGYFGRLDLTSAAFFRDETGRAWYRTGDQVLDDGDGSFVFRGRRDRMVKRRGYRIELGEIEAALQGCDDVSEAAVVAETDGDGLSIAAFVVMKPGRKGSIIAVKRHCATHLPPYMIPDRVAFLPELPQTSTGKVDYQGLRRLGRDDVSPPATGSETSFSPPTQSPSLSRDGRGS